MVAVTNCYKLRVFRTTEMYFHSSRGQKPEIKVDRTAGQYSLEALVKNLFFASFQLRVADLHISVSSACLSENLYSCLSYKRIHVIAFRAHPDNP